MGATNYDSVPLSANWGHVSNVAHVRSQFVVLCELNGAIGTMFCSTRSLEVSKTFKDIALAGYAPDGGLYVPRKFFEITEEKLRYFHTLSYVSIVKEVLAFYASDIPRDKLDSIIDQSFAQFIHSQDGEVLPLRQVGDAYFLEMFNGPSGAFKDLALSVLGNIINYYLELEKKKLIILVGTSGDTGSAAIHASKHSKWIDIVVLYPRGRVSDIQALQMTTHAERNVHVIGVDGNSDELDRPIRAVFDDREFTEAHAITSINSINLVRILVQSCHYVYSSAKLMQQDGSGLFLRPVTFFVPTGAAGNIASALLAHRMGIPLKIVACVNENDVIARCLRTANKDVVATNSPSMDITVPYNWERVMYFTSFDAEMVSSVMTEYYDKASVTMPQEFMELIRPVMSSHVVNQVDTVSTIRAYHAQHVYLLDPHSAVAAAGWEEVKKSSLSEVTVACCLCTATPAKFPQTVLTAIGLEDDVEGRNRAKLFGGRFEELRTCAQYDLFWPRDQMESWEAALREKVKQISHRG